MKKLFVILNLILISSVSYSQVTIFDSLQLYYPFDEIYTNLVPDESGNENRGIAFGVIPTKDRFEQQDKALYFNGNSYVYFDGELFNFTEYTYSLWIKIEDPPSYGEMDFVLDIGSAYGVDQMLTYTNNFGSNALDGLFGASYNTDGSHSYISQHSLLEPNEWKFVVYTRSNEYLKLYIDGEIKELTSIEDVFPIYGNNIKGLIGCRNNFEQYFTGYIDDVRIYNYPISQSTVEELYNLDILDIAQQKNDSHISVFPVPSSNFIHLKLEDSIKDFQIEIYNSTGLIESNHFNMTKVDISKLKNGFYLLLITDNSNNNKFTSKFIKN